jgi:hypothetical protein
MLPSNCLLSNRLLSLLRICRGVSALGLLILGGIASAAELESPITGHQLPITFSNAITSKRDAWGEAAMSQPNGPSYEFFEPLLPPPRYVNSDFRFYPIVLSAPKATVKARLISNGSGVNLRGGTRSWNDVGTAFFFRVGPDELRFGEFLDRLEHPTLAEGYLPIPEIRYAHDTQVYKFEAFVSTDPSPATPSRVGPIDALLENAVVFVKFSLASGHNNFITVQPDGRSPVKFANGELRSGEGQLLACFDKNWAWERQSAHATIGTNKSATLLIVTKPFPKGAESESLLCSPAESYDTQRKLCADTWKKLLAEGMNVETPEPLVNNAWRNFIIQNFELINGDSMRYSAGNQYDKLYEAEGSDAALAMMMWGYEAETRRLIPPLLDFTRKNLEFHQAGHKLDDICRYYWQTRDADFVKAMRPRWEKEIERIAVSRTNEHGLFPKEQYCGDIATPVYSLNSNAKCWAALRDLVPVLREIGDNAAADHVAAMASEFHKNILAALDKSIRRDTDPPFVPIALFGDEEIHDPITHARIGGYWNLMANYIIGTRVLAGERENWLPHYLETHGGLCMGMTRTGGELRTFWTGIPRTNPLYGLRYVEDVLRRDEPDRALVNFYGVLAQGCTRNTFVGAEGCSLTPLDSGGRIFYCPPNSASNAEWLSTFRRMLVQDWDLDDDGRPETLRIAFATPKRWLEDGKVIKVERAPTAFGPVSFRLESHLDKGQIVAEIDPPHRNQPKQTLLRARVPNGWKVISAEMGDKTLQTDAKGTVDISSLKNESTIIFQVKQTSN